VKKTRGVDLLLSGCNAVEVIPENQKRPQQQHFSGLLASVIERITDAIFKPLLTFNKLNCGLERILFQNMDFRFIQSPKAAFEAVASHFILPPVLPNM
jgi:hypothetical protein